MDRMRYLVDTLNKWAYEYYVQDAPSVSDREYDALYDELKELERETGVTPIPVWHPCRMARGFEEMCERYPYVAIGTTDIRRQLAKSVAWFTQTAHRYGTEIHGLGYTKLDGLARTGFDSVDSTAWLFSNKSGTVYDFDGHAMRKRKTPDGKRLVIKNNLLHSLVEWAKFSDHLEARCKASPRSS